MNPGLYSFPEHRACVLDGNPSYSTTALRLTHSIGTKPVNVRTVLVCLSPELGYDAGDEVDIFGTIDSAADHQPAYSVAVSDTAVYVNYSLSPSSAPTPYFLRNRGTNAFALFTAAKWALKIYLNTPITVP